MEKIKKRGYVYTEMIGDIADKVNELVEKFNDLVDSKERDDDQQRRKTC